MDVFHETHTHDQLFPFHLMYHFQENQGTRTVPYNHHHKWYEIVYVHSGTGTFFIDHHFFDMEEGDIFLVPSDVIHRGIPSKNTPYIVTVVLFNPTMIHSIVLGENITFTTLLTQSYKKSIYRYPAKEIDHEPYIKILDGMHHEWVTKKEGYRYSLHTALHQLIILILRNRFSLANPNIHISPPSISWMDDIFSYIDSHLACNLTLKHLAEQALVSTSHFSRKFKESTGFSLPEYLNLKRVMESREILINSTESLFHIAEQCGFKSISHFHLVFKKYTETTPSKYRKKFHNLDQR